MELKFLHINTHIVSGFCSNRTFMELKSSIADMAKVILISSNRTFMELKSP